MKYKVTKKEMRNNFRDIVSIGYCEAQYLLKYQTPQAYSAGIYGWACDYYVVDGILISTGYSPISSKNMHATDKLIQEYEDKARDVVTMIGISFAENVDGCDIRRTKVNYLLYEFLQKCKIPEPKGGKSNKNKIQTETT